MKIDFAKNDGLVPAIVQDATTQKVLMLGYMNQESYKKTVDEKKVTFFSRSRQELWTKGETSGNELLVKEIILDLSGCSSIFSSAFRNWLICSFHFSNCFFELCKITKSSTYLT